MSSLDFGQYTVDRFDDQLKWYSSKAAINKKWYRGYQIAIATLSALTTVTIALGMHESDGNAWHIASLVGSAAVAALAGLQKAFRFHENWVEYRTTAEQLKKERYYYEFRCGEYSTTESVDRLFVERVEALISRQHTLWTVGTLHRQEHGASGGKPTLPEETSSPVSRAQAPDSPTA